jgi:hypothetical protein
MTQTQLLQTQILYIRVVFVLGSRVVLKIVNPNDNGLMFHALILFC